MTPRIRRTMAHLAVWVLAATASIVGSASPAQAFGGETFGCRITTVTWSAPCYNTKWTAGTYTAGFNLLNLSGSDYTFSWSYSGDYLSVTGCTPTDSGCGFTMANADGYVTATVTYSQGGQTGAKSATAIVRQFCWGPPPHLC